MEDDLSHCNVGRCPGLAVNLITSIDFFSLIISRLVETTRSRARQSRATLSSLTARESQTWILLQVSRSTVSGQREWCTVGHFEGLFGHLYHIRYDINISRKLLCYLDMTPPTVPLCTAMQYMRTATQCEDAVLEVFTTKHFVCH